ncbi:hypothetical protein ACLOJK_030333 [Asimina triloba]
MVITHVIDIEETAWSPRYGLKGMIDASLRVKIDSGINGTCEKIMPMEFKTGKGTSGQSAMEHCAQVILYTLLMSDRYLKDINSGLLYYLHTDQTRGIEVRRSDAVALIMCRNELATNILKASRTQILPPIVQSHAKAVVTLTSALSIIRIGRQFILVNYSEHAHLSDNMSLRFTGENVHGGNTESSGLGDVFDSHVEHLTDAHCDFFRHWDRLIDLEANETQVSKKEIWHSSGLRKEHNTNSLFSIVLDVSNEFSPKPSSKDGRYFYSFMRKELLFSNAVKQMGEKRGAAQLGISDLDCTLRRGDRVVRILSTESGRVAVANGIISDIDRFHVSVSLSRRLRLPGSSPSSEIGDLMQEVWRMDKDEFASSSAIMRFNLTQLFAQNPQSSHLRKVIVDLEVPRFDSGGIFSQDPAISYVRSEKNMNDDQRRAVHKILTAKDYALILGMPGTGKTSTMVHAVKALLIRGASILLTSYTNSAVDNLLIKLKAQVLPISPCNSISKALTLYALGETKPCMMKCVKIAFQVGLAIIISHPMSPFTFFVSKSFLIAASNIHSVEEIKQRINQVSIVGVTCLGITHPLLAHRKFDICIMDEAGQITLPGYYF